MSVGLLNPLIGKNIVIGITPQIVTLGTMTPDTFVGTQYFYGKLDPLDNSWELTTDNISPLDVWNSNPVPYEFTGRYTINEIIMAHATPISTSPAYGSGSVLASASAMSFYHYLGFFLYDDDYGPFDGGSIIYQEYAYVLMDRPKQYSGTKSKNIWSANFSTIAVFDASAGTPLANPDYNGWVPGAIG